MGHTVRQTADRCEGYQSDHVLLFSLMINLKIDLNRIVGMVYNVLLYYQLHQ